MTAVVYRKENSNISAADWSISSTRGYVYSRR